MARAQALCEVQPPTDAQQVLALLSDEVDGTDEKYPIYRRAVPPDRGATLCTALFDLDARQLQVYAGHPIQEPERRLVLDL